MTAEGDNRVLMQKVVKDILADFQKKRHPMPKMTMCPRREIPAKSRVSDLATLVNLIYYKEVAEIKNISTVMQKMILEDGKPFFDAWMYELSDEQQSLAIAFAERYMLEAAIALYEKCSHVGVKDLLYNALMLHCLTLVHDNMAWYLQNKVISHEAAAELETAQILAVKAFVPFTNTALEGLGIIRPVDTYPPIARDYVAFNAQDDNDNFNAAGSLFDFRTTGMPRAKL